MVAAFTALRRTGYNPVPHIAAREMLGDFLTRLRSEADVSRILLIAGLAGPATPATLMKFALRCGLGNSMRAVRSQIGRFGRLRDQPYCPDGVRRPCQASRT
ncbi:hypothetical protein KMZ29_18580 [Bradyrhizobium sediminis]|uniref:Uncharacterized protein n=1 Tax=Bradyrhizobium sediminis TaxID=2840469 RepID=A0A975NBZ8_9BRAD|nr:hypothetical protein [Bradyrhizobium sediminis]QWG11721.1 hypothetical protein KMZ29_18580 [Bradyrhizobium sediminis]